MAFVSWETETTGKLTRKKTRQIPKQYVEKTHAVLWRAGKVTKRAAWIRISPAWEEESQAQSSPKNEKVLKKPQEEESDPRAPKV